MRHHRQAADELRNQAELDQVVGLDEIEQVVLAGRPLGLAVAEADDLLAEALGDDAV